MRIAYVTETYPPEINGVALTVARTVAFLRGRGHRVDLVRPAQAGERPGAGDEEWRSAGYPIPVYRELRFGIARSSALAERFAATGAQLVHVATEGPLGWAAVSAARALGLPATTDFRTNFHQYSRYYRAGWMTPVICNYLRRFHNRSACTFAPTEQTCGELRAEGFERVEALGRGVDLQRFSPTKRDLALRLRWQVGNGDPVLLHVGRLAAEKNVGLAFRAYADARRLDPATRLVVVGDGPERRRFERLFPEAIFVGMQTGDALAAHYASADVFVFASLSETFGNVVLEALASGLPVVAFDRAAAEHVGHRIGGLLAPPGDAPAFVAAVSELVASPAALAPMRAAARRGVALQDWDTVLGGFERRLLATARDTEPAGSSAALAA